MRLNGFNKKIVALWALMSLLGSMGLLCHGFSPVAIAQEMFPNTAVAQEQGMDECGEAPERQKPSGPLQNDGRNKFLPCCYQKQDSGQASQGGQITIEKRTEYILQPLTATSQDEQGARAFFSHDPPNSMTDQLKTVVKRE